jgi:folylpolyglutamate synthase/dihydropteroate synthase
MSRFPNYGTALKYLYGLNHRLKAQGVLAPDTNSLSHTLSLYNLIGKPLDRIPTIHVGGTNGKVRYQLSSN